MNQVRPPHGAARRRLPADLGPRVAVAVPAAAALIAVNHVGGPVFAAVLAFFGFLGHRELARMAGVGPAAAVAGALAVGAAPLLALDGGATLAAGGAIAVALASAAAAALGRDEARRAVAVTALGVLWLGTCLGHAVLLRELGEGAVWVIAVLLATFLGDTAAQLVGTAFGRHRLAPAISPNKTVEGLAAGIAGGTLACAAYLLAFHDLLDAAEAIALGLACSLAAPAGDLFESALKRRAGVKDSGRLFGAHGGVLDRIDAAIVAALVGYYVVRALT